MISLHATVLLSLATTASAGWCDDKSTGYHCRDGGSQFCRCEMEYKWKRRLEASPLSERRRLSSRRRSKQLKAKYDCDSVGGITPCPNGCNYNSGKCVEPTQVCGTSWALSPLGTCSSASWNSWKNIMDSPTITTNLLSTVNSDLAWFVSLMDIHLYKPTSNSSVSVDANGSATVTLPASLATMKAGSDVIYKLFTCSRNLPKCTNDRPDYTECQTRCLDISTKIAQFSAECQRLLDVQIAANNSNPGFECNTLSTLSVADGGCTAPWCRLVPGAGVLNQGWERDCNQLCSEAAPLAPKNAAAPRAGVAMAAFLAAALSSIY